MHFGIAGMDEDTGLMKTASRRDAKMPEQQFATDSERKRTEASDAMIAAAELFLEPVHQHLIGLEEQTD